MYRLFTTLRVRARDRVVQGTTFCEECSQVCTSACRRDALLDRYRQDAQRAGLFHL